MGTILEVVNLTKIYDGGILANHNINFSVDEGEIHALVGENGAGKSTLMKMLFGLESVTSGEIFIRGENVHYTSSKEAIGHGIGMVHQHFMLVNSLTAMENLILGIKSKGVFLDRKKSMEEATAIAAKYNFEIDFDKRIRDISVGMKQKLEILKVLYRGANIIILDEPTAVLTPQETDELFERLMDLKKAGFTIIFISHKLGEVKRISDRITVLQNGKSKGTYQTADVSQEEISRLMVGRDVVLTYDKQPTDTTQELMRIEHVSFTNQFKVERLHDVSMAVSSGEIVGICGVEGNGQSELVEILTGNEKIKIGKVTFLGKDVTNQSMKNMRQAGLTYIPEDRMHNGCAGQLSIEENLVVSNVDSFANKLLVIDKVKIKDHCNTLIKDFLVKTKDEKQRIKGLSGGNIQKVIVAREFSAGGPLLLANQPTRGVDVGAIEFIHKKLIEKRNAGTGILLVSADLSELLGLSDRIVVMCKGRVVANLVNDKAHGLTEEELGLYMLGVKSEVAV